MGPAARMSVEKRYNLVSVLEAYEALYDELGQPAVAPMQASRTQ